MIGSYILALDPLALPPADFEPIQVGTWIDICKVETAWEDQAKGPANWSEIPPHVADQKKC